ncbi:MAG TPA: FAD-dependent oxidoreductase [Oculatellaceae cyanobacterium]
MAEANKYHYLVVGKGMLGSAAAKYLSAKSDRVAIVGPDEPADLKTHEGVFSSHYDSGRITRILDTEYVWALAAKRSIEAYPVIEEKSGVKFFQPVGCLKIVDKNDNGDAYLSANTTMGNKLGVLSERLNHSELQTRWPFLHFGNQCNAIFERKTAGHIDPRKLVSAQLVLAKQNQADIFNDTVTQVTRLTSGSLEVKTQSGNKLEAEKVIITAGGFTNFNNLLPVKLDLRPRAETVMLARISQTMAEVLLDMPSAIWFINSRANLTYVYIVPPVRYPDGNFYIKMGGDRELDHEFSDLQQLKEWFHSEGGAEAASDFRELIQEMLPNLKAEAWISKPCVITDTRTHRPYIGLVEDNLFVAAGGCGAAAKSSDEFGRLAALCATGQPDPSYGENAFPVVLADDAHTSQSERRFKF